MQEIADCIAEFLEYDDLVRLGACSRTTRAKVMGTKWVQRKRAAFVAKVYAPVSVWEVSWGPNVAPLMWRPGPCAYTYWILSTDTTEPWFPAHRVPPAWAPTNWAKYVLVQFPARGEAYRSRHGAAGLLEAIVGQHVQPRAAAGAAR